MAKKKASAKKTSKIPSFTKGKPGSKAKAKTTASSVSTTAQVKWHKFSWGYSSKWIRPAEDVSTKRSIDIKRNSEKKNKPATQTVSLSLHTFDFAYTVSKQLGGDPRKEYEAIQKAVGVYAPLYLNGKRFLCKNMLLKSAEATDWVLSRTKEPISVTIRVKFEQYEHDKQKLHKDAITKKSALRPGVVKKSSGKKSAAKIKASASDKASKKKK